MRSLKPVPEKGACFSHHFDVLTSSLRCVVPEIGFFFLSNPLFLLVRKKGLGGDFFVLSGEILVFLHYLQRTLVKPGTLHGILIENIVGERPKRNSTVTNSSCHLRPLLRKLVIFSIYAFFRR